MSFTIFQNEKTLFQVIKTRNIKIWNLTFFEKGLTHGFGPKLALFSNFFFLGNIVQENVFYDISERKNAFLGYKKEKFKKSKNCYFSKGVNPRFLVQNWPFLQPILGNISQEDVVYDILDRKKRPL